MFHAYREQGDHVMSWRNQWTLNNPLRALIHPPTKLFGKLVEPGMTVVDTGCGTGFFSLALARMVGAGGRVIAVDLQPEALARLEEKAERAGLLRTIETWKCEADDIGRLPEADFAVSFYMAHETPDMEVYFKRMGECVRPGGHMLLAEPKFHVSRDHFKRELEAAQRAGFDILTPPRVLGSHAALLRRG